MSDSLQTKLATLNDSEKKELSHWIEVESSKSKFQATIHKFNDVCFKRCVEASSPGLSTTESQCLQGCLRRFIDTQNVILNQLKNQGR